MASIYKLYSIVNPLLIYIGSTRKPLQVRLANHIIAWDSFKRGLNKSKISSYEIIDSEEYGIELLEECDMNDRYIREQYFIDLLPCCNKNSAYTGIIGNQKTKESWASYQRQHYALNRDAHLARKTRYNNNNKETIRNKYRIKKLFQQLPFSLI
jgi:hypothetical protein